METLVRNWWAVVLRGAVAVLFGILLLAQPKISLIFLIVLWGAYAVADGIFSLVSAVRAGRAGHRWGALALVGVTGILAGILAWVMPGITALVLTFLIGAWAIIVGVLQIVAAIDLRKEIRGEFWLGLAGLISIAFGILVFANPGAGILAIVWLIGIYAILFGVTLFALGFRLRSLGHGRTLPA